MRKILFVIGFVLVGFFGFGQGSTGSLSFSYTPSQNGFSFTGTLKYQYSVLQNQPMIKFASAINLDRSRIMYEGKWYNSSDLEDAIDEVELNKTFGFTVDIYDNAQKITTDNISFAELGWVAEFPSWSHVLTNVSGEKAKELFNKGFYVRNAQISGVVSFEMKHVENKIHEIEDNHDDMVVTSEKHYTFLGLELEMKTLEKACEKQDSIQLPQKDTAKTSKNDFHFETGTMTDHRDGQKYKTVTVGKQVWMAENLNFKVKKHSFCYNGKRKHCKKYGRLYVWETAQNACPAGWHMPSKQEFSELINFFGDGENAYKGLINNGNTGFNAQFGGCQYENGECQFIGKYGEFWSSSNYDDEFAYKMQVSSSNETAAVDFDERSMAFSVRCVKDRN